VRSPRAPRAAVSCGALERNAASVAHPDAVADLRRDAYGHGTTVVAAALTAAGVHRALLDDVDVDAATAAGLVPAASPATLDPRELFGLPGGTGEPVMRVSGSVLSTKVLRAGEGVSYNYTHVAPRDTRIALVSGGYGQGIVRSLGNRVSVEIAGMPHRIVGRVAMDVCVVDVGDAPVQVDDDVVYFGGSGSARNALTQWEAVTGLRATEIVCALGVHLAREVTA
jgi:alanine racemase